MPKEGGKHFPYTAKGKKAAKSYAKKSGKKVEKYYGGGKVGMTTDPFSTKNPEGLPHQQMIQAIEKEDERAGIEEDIPTTDAQGRSQVSPDTTEYKEGGKVDVTDVVKEVSKSSVRYEPDLDAPMEKVKRWGKGKYKWKDAPAGSRRAEGDKRKRTAVRDLAKKALEGKKK